MAWYAACVYDFDELTPVHLAKQECEGRCTRHMHAMAAAIFGGQHGSRLWLADGSSLDLEQLGSPMLSMVSYVCALWMRRRCAAYNAGGGWLSKA